MMMLCPASDLKHAVTTSSSAVMTRRIAWRKAICLMAMSSLVLDRNDGFLLGGNDGLLLFVPVARAQEQCSTASSLSFSSSPSGSGPFQSVATMGSTSSTSATSSSSPTSQDAALIGLAPTNGGNGDDLEVCGNMTELVSDGDGGRRGSWYRADGTGRVLQASTCPSSSSDGDMSGLTSHSVYVFAGSACDELICVGKSILQSDCDASGAPSSLVPERFPWESADAAPYYLYVTAPSNDVGEFRLTLSELDSPENDRCDAATAMTIKAADDDTDQYVVSGSTGNATLEHTVSASSDTSTSSSSELVCRVDEEAPGVWYKVVGTGDVLRASSCHDGTNFDTAVSVFPAGDGDPDGCADLRQCVAGSQDTTTCDSVDGSSVAWPSEQGATYYILLHGNSPDDVGEFALSVQAVVPAENDLCQNASGPLNPDIDLGDAFVFKGSTIDATTDSLNFCGQNLVQSPGVWYYVVGTGTVMQVSTCTSETDFDTSVTVYTGHCNEFERDLQCVYGGDDDSECGTSEFHTTVSFATEYGRNYYILIHGSLEYHVGDFGFTLIDYGDVGDEGGQVNEKKDDESSSLSSRKYFSLLSLIGTAVVIAVFVPMTMLNA